MHPCEFLWGEMYVWYDGKCNPCDVDYKSELEVGNINKNSIKEIWNGELYKNLRSSHLSGKRSECFPCDRCSNW
jgi:radical SAM protein with 4Fe4S-binding SPASM domain